MLPALNQMRSMLAADPQTKTLGDPVESLHGEVLFDRISFRYTPDGPLVLSDVTIHVRPGEFIAIAGESGAGKSTLFRLAIGLDRPTNGAVYYDGRDLRHLNLKQLRRKMGVVPSQCDFIHRISGTISSSTMKTPVLNKFGERLVPLALSRKFDQCRWE